MTSNPPTHSASVTRGLEVTGSIGGTAPLADGEVDGAVEVEVEGAVEIDGRGDVVGYAGCWRLCDVDGRGP